MREGRERERERETSLCFKTRIIWMCENREGEGREGWKEREEGLLREIEWGGGGEERVGGRVRVGEWGVRERE